MTRSNRLSLLIAGLVALGLAAPAGADISQPLNAGEKLIYAVTGVQNDTTGSDTMATVFVCTNLGSDNVQYTVEIFDSSGSQIDSGTTTLTPGETDAFETQDVVTISTFNLSAPFIGDGGSARLVFSGAKKVSVICTAYIIDPDATEATAYMNLPVALAGKAVKAKTRKP